MKGKCRLHQKTQRRMEFLSCLHLFCPSAPAQKKTKRKKKRLYLQIFISPKGKRDLTYKCAAPLEHYHSPSGMLLTDWLTGWLYMLLGSALFQQISDTLPADRRPSLNRRRKRTKNAQKEKTNMSRCCSTSPHFIFYFYLFLLKKKKSSSGEFLSQFCIENWLHPPWERGRCRQRSNSWTYNNLLCRFYYLRICHFKSI